VSQVGVAVRDLPGWNDSIRRILKYLNSRDVTALMGIKIDFSSCTPNFIDGTGWVSYLSGRVT
jgi:hypothetical protein